MSDVDTIRRINRLEQQRSDQRSSENRGASIGDMMLYEHRHGGGALMYAFLADHTAIESYIGSQQLTAPGIGFTDWAATAAGGPYVDLDGATEALYIGDATWQEPGANTLAVGHWFNLRAVPAVGTSYGIVSKFDIAGVARSWTLVVSNIAGSVTAGWVCNATGGAGGDVALLSTLQLAPSTWYYAHAFYQPSTLMRTFVAAATSSTMTIDSLAVGVPATLYNGPAPLAIGTQFSTAPALFQPFNGYIGIGAARIALPAASIDEYAKLLFAETRYKYR